MQVTLTTGVSKVRGKEVSEPQPHIWAPAHALRSVLPCVLSNDNILICFSAKETYWLIYQSSPRSLGVSGKACSRIHTTYPEMDLLSILRLHCRF